MANRIERLLKALPDLDVEALVVTRGSDIRYLTGFTGEYGISVLVVREAGCLFVTDGRFEAQAAAEVGGQAEVRIVKRWGGEPATYFTCTGDALRELGVSSAGIVAADLSLSDYEELAAHATGVALKRVANPVAPIRMIKDADELARIRRACQISMRSFYALLDFIRPGVTEAQVANELDRQFHAHGAQGPCFATIVASGPDNGACPHSTVSDRKLELGDFVTIDFGCRYAGYCSDITRTLVLGLSPRPELYQIWNVVQGAKDLGASMLGPGVSIKEVSAAVTGYIADRGYTMPHSVGHGIGIDIHEEPFMGRADDLAEAPGMVHTVEPGIYIPGLGGVRQEDDYLITEGGVERLTYITDHLIEL